MNQIKRLARHDWPMHFVLLLTNWLPDNVFFMRLRGRLARPFLKNCGERLCLGRNLTFYNPSRISFGRDVYIAYGCWFMAGDEISIGDEVMFGPYCVTVASKHTRQGESCRFGQPVTEPIIIGKGVWVGAHVTLIAGSSIGDGSVIAAGAVVRGSICSGVLAGGMPASIIKQFENK